MKRTLASLLYITLFFGMMAIANLPAAGATGGSYFGIGDYTAHLAADPATDTPPSDFGTTATNGATYTNTASVTRINESDVYNPVETSTTVTAYRTYKVEYV